MFEVTMPLENLIDNTHFVLGHPNVVPVSVFQSRDDVPLLSIAYVRNWGQHGLKASLKGKNHFQTSGKQRNGYFRVEPDLDFRCCRAAIVKASELNDTFVNLKK